jgi:hypothetical protein
MHPKACIDVRLMDYSHRNPRDQIPISDVLVRCSYDACMYLQRFILDFGKCSILSQVLTGILIGFSVLSDVITTFYLSKTLSGMKCKSERFVGDLICKLLILIVRVLFRVVHSEQIKF